MSSRRATGGGRGRGRGRGAAAVAAMQQQQEGSGVFAPLPAAGSALLPPQHHHHASAVPSSSAAAAAAAAAPTAALVGTGMSEVVAKYNLMCPVGEGTYGVVYKAELRPQPSGGGAFATTQQQQPPPPKRARSVAVGAAGVFASPSSPPQSQLQQQQQQLSLQQQLQPVGGRVAIKKFRATKDGEGISLTACREIGLLKELDHENVVRLLEVILNPREKSLFLVFEYAEYDLFVIIKYHRDKGLALPESLVKSCMWQITNGVNYLHANWVMHRDIKPSNIMVTGIDSPAPGRIKIGDFGLARVFQSPLRSLSENGVVVTIWYRAPELLLMSRHYTPAIDMWAIGCIFAELMNPRPLFQGKEKNQADPSLFQDDQVEKIFRVLGTPQPELVPFIAQLPRWADVLSWPTYPCVLGKMFQHASRPAFDLLTRMLHYDPNQRITAADALDHPYFKTPPLPTDNVFGNAQPPYPLRQAVAQQQQQHHSHQQVAQRQSFARR